MCMQVLRYVCETGCFHNVGVSTDDLWKAPPITTVWLQHLEVADRDRSFRKKSWTDVDGTWVSGCVSWEGSGS